ncbi:DUF11 domain-containing protein [Amycolatopsis nigrescens]|uniref:DUF11 domain-containing protein n=1 Tax=Amycolatopsis nigrescens TaxID=381445 RepID=UPI000360B1E4|nr:DUF11 domain-containing protein [Amycolatopsis nigrescens]
MVPRSLLRRGAALAGVVLLSAGIATASPAAAAEPEVEVSVSPSTAQPGDVLTVTETIRNQTGGSILNPTARLFSEPTPITAYSTLEGCTGAAVCTTVDGPDGPVGYQAVLAAAMDNNQAVTVTFTLRLSAELTELDETLLGQLFGRNYATEKTPGPALTVRADADASVKLTGTPKFGLLVSRLEFTVTIGNAGPARLRNAKVTTTLPAGLNANASGACAAGAAGVVCTVPELAAGATTKLTFSVPLKLLSLGLPYRFTASRTASDSHDPNPANDTAATTCTVLTPLLAGCG